jgi:hypothetical protein
MLFALQQARVEGETWGTFVAPKKGGPAIRLCVYVRLKGCTHYSSELQLSAPIDWDQGVRIARPEKVLRVMEDQHEDVLCRQLRPPALIVFSALIGTGCQG